MYYFPFPASPPQVTANDRRRAAEAAMAGAETALGELTQHLVSWRRPVSFHSGGYHLGRTIASLFGEDAVAPAVSAGGGGAAAPAHDEPSSDLPLAVVEPSWLKSDVPTVDRLAAETARFGTRLDGLKKGSGRPVLVSTAAPAEQPTPAPAEQPAAAPVNPYLPIEGETPEAWQHRLFDSSQGFAKLAERDPDRAASLRAQMNEAIEAQPGFRDKLNAYRQNIDPEFYADPEGYVARLGLPPEALKEVPRAQVDIAHPDGADPIEAFIRSNGNNFIKIAANGKVYDVSGLPRGLFHKPPIATLYEHNSAALQQDEARKALDSGDRGKIVDFVIANDPMAPAQSAIEIGSRLGTPFVGGPAAPKARSATEPEERPAEDGPRDGDGAGDKQKGQERRTADEPPDPDETASGNDQGALSGNDGNVGAKDAPVGQSLASAPAAPNNVKGLRKTSGLRVVPRPGMTSRVVSDSNGHPVTIYGQAERSSSKTSGHAEAMNDLAERLARSGNYEYITIQRSLRTATGRVGTSRNIPDVIGVRRDGLVDQFEIRSATDNETDLWQRLQKSQATLPDGRRGDILVLPPKPRRIEQD